MSRERTRILHVHHGTALGGAPTSLARLLAGLDRDRFESMLALPAAGVLSRRFRSLGIPVFTGPITAFYYLAQAPRVRWSTRLKESLLGASNRRFVTRLIREQRPAIVHLNTALLPVSMEAAAESGTPVVVHVRELIPDDDPAARDRIVTSAARASRVVAISEAAAAPFRSRCNVSVIHEGVDAGSWYRPELRDGCRAEWGAAADDMVLVYPAMLLPGKGQEAFLDAAARLRNRFDRLQVWFAGGGDGGGYPDRLKRRAAELGLADRVRWLGWRDDLPAVFAAAEVIVFLPGREEGFGLPVLEAMAAGRPVVTSDHGPAREIVQEGETGLLVDPGDPDQVCRALEGLLVDARRRAAMGEAGFERARERFDLQGMIRAFETLFASVS